MFNVKRITIGCDPEFVVKKNADIIYAERVLPWSFRTKSFGHDGAIFEVRPGYSHNVLKVISSIKNLLEEAYSNLKGLQDCKWIAGHYVGYMAIGGHIHLGNIFVDGRYIALLVTALGNVLINGMSNKIDNIHQRCQRRNAGYGGYDDHRIQESKTAEHSPYGANMITRLEYRAPGSFLVSPTITFINLILAKIVTMEICARIHGGIRERSILSVKKVPDTILSNLISVAETNPIFNDEEDILLGIKVIKHFMTNNVKVSWKKDFKHSWGIE